MTGSNPLVLTTRRTVLFHIKDIGEVGESEKKRDRDLYSVVDFSPLVYLELLFKSIQFNRMVLLSDRFATWCESGIECLCTIDYINYRDSDHKVTSVMSGWHSGLKVKGG